MAGVFVSPGVYVLERDLSDYAPALATSIFGVVGAASWGPVNELSLITNENKLINDFGKPALSGSSPDYTARYPAVTSGIHYLRNGSQFFMIRVVDGNEVKATVDIPDDGTEAEFTSSADLTGGVDLSTNKYAYIDVNNAGPVLVDLAAGAALATAVTRTEILANLTTALGSVMTSVAEAGGGGEEYMKLTTLASGATAEIEFQTPPGNAATSATVDSVAEPYNMQFLASPQLTMEFDDLGPQNVSFTFGAATAAGTNTETFNFSAGGETLSFDVILPGDTTAIGTQTVTFQTGMFAAPAAATAAEVAAAINASGVIGISALENTGAVDLVSDKRGTGASIASITGTAATILGIPASASGSGDAADATVVTAAEVAGKITALPPAGSATAVAASGVVTLTSGSTGSTSEIDITLGNGIFSTGVTNGLDASPPLDATLTVFGVAPTNTTNGTGPFATVDATALYHGTRGNDVSIQIEAGTTANTANYVVLVEGFETERFNNVALASVEDIESAWVVFTDLGTSTEDPTPGTYPLVGGNSGDASLDAADYIGQAVGNTVTGLQLLADSETVDVNIIAVPGVDDGAVIAAMDTLCQGRGDCMFLADPPLGEDVEGVVDWHNGEGAYDGLHTAFNTSYGATWWSWIRWYDNYSQANVWVPPSGFLAGIMAYTDNTTETWFAPAGLNRGRIPEGLSVEHSPDQGQRDFMYSGGNAVNPIVDSTTFGIYVKGQRTLQRTSTALDRINVRRLMLYLRKVVATSIVRLEFEQNDSNTWQRFKSIVNPIMASVRARRGVEDYRIIMDETTNTPDVINRNEMRGRILLKPTKVAEIIVVEFTLLPSGATFAESIA